MMTYVNVNRRRFLQRALGYCSVLYLPRPLRALATQAGTQNADPLLMTLANFFVHKESAKVIGRAYLQSVPEESEVSRLVAGICSFQAEQHTECAKATPKRYRELLLHQQRQDFEHGRVVNVAGWILSQTEARLCALVTLL